ncbi:DUF2029 domain-containing protein, partial [bacterium]|nr:DUF2029 domain-containing protein [bacterium]
MPFKSDFYKKVTLRKEHTKYLSIPFIFICAYYIAKYFLIAAYGTTLGDFGVYYYIPKAVLELARPEHPYTNFTPIYPYFFPPASIPLFKILLFFPYYLAKYIWTILNFSLILGSLYLMFDYFNKKIDWTYFFLLSISLAFHPTQFTLREGQFNIVMLFIFTIVLWGIKKNKSIKPGILLGIGVVTKISPALLLIYAMYKKHYKLAFIAILTILSLTILAEIKVKKGINFYYLSHVMADVSTQSKGINNRDQSILGLVKKIDFKDPKIHIAKKTLSKDNIRSLISYSIVGTFLAIYLLADLYKKSKKNTEIDYAILLIIGVIGTGLTWFHQYTMLLLALYILFFVIQKIENKNNKILAWGVFFISYFLMFRTSS